MESLRLSVIMGNYNHGRYIKEALDSIAEQSWKPFEVIICDDASTDDSLEIIRKFTNKYSFMRLIRNETNLGTAATYRRLTDAASGDYLYATGADDKFMPDFFKKSINILAQYPQAGISSGLSYIIDGNGKKIGFITVPLVSFKKPCFLSPYKVRDIFTKQGCWISGYSSIVRLDYFRLCGGYRPNLHSFTDNFVYQVLALKFGACFIPEPITCCRRIRGSYSVNMPNKPEIFNALIDNATHLMRTEFSDIFPEKYIEKWRRENYFVLRCSMYKKEYQEKIKLLCSPAGSAGPIKKLISWWVKQLLFLKETAIVCYSLVIFKQNAWRKCCNKILCSMVRRHYDSR